MTDNIAVTAANLTKHNFQVHRADTAAQATEWLLTQISPAQVAGHGGSVTIGQLGIVEKLRERGNLVLSNAGLSKECGQWARKQTLFGDVYLTSANAVTQSGEILNIDGTGNRVAASFYGPDTVYFCVGRNKIVADEAEGIQRIKAVTCPKNAQRLGLDTPCGVTGVCTDCNAPQRFCNVYVRLDRPPWGKRLCVLLIDEELGY